MTFEYAERRLSRMHVLEDDEDPAWSRWLRALPAPPVALSRAHAQQVQRLWQALRDAVEAPLTIPAGCLTSDGNLCFIWDTGAVVLQAEVLASGRVDWCLIRRSDYSSCGAEGQEVEEAALDLRDQLAEVGLVA